MKRKYLQEYLTCKLMGGSTKSEASTFDVLVLVVVPAARLVLCSPTFKPFWRYLEVYLQLFKVAPTFH